MRKSKLSVQDICMIAFMTAVTAVMAQISIPMPFGVPMTMQTFAITLSGVILGSKKGGLSILIYVLIGLAGIPVFANFSGGIQCLAGPTGGFLISFPIMAFLIGLGADSRNKWIFLLFVTLGTLANYVIGLAFFCLVMQSSLAAGLAACVIPFLPTAVIKAVTASLLGIQIQKRLNRVLQFD